MDDIGSLGSQDDQQIIQRMTAYFDAPAFIRRIKRVEEADRLLQEQLTRQRGQRLAMVRLRVGQLAALAGDWAALGGVFASESDVADVRRLHDELQPRLRLPLEPTASARTLRAAAVELVEALELFNARWRRHIETLDLSFINQLRDGYNRHYLLEKECALGSSRVARLGFRPLDPVTAAELIGRFPPLAIPTLA
jgi:hypothetical protein